MALRKYVWPTIATLAIVFSGWLLYRELRGLSPADPADSLAAIPHALGDPCELPLLPQRLVRIH